MRTRAKVLTVATAMVTTFTILPTLAAAADTLEDGAYDIVVDETTYTVEVVDGIPVIDTIEGVEFAFEFDDETGRVLDEFDLTVDGLVHEIEIADDGAVEVTADDADDGDLDDDAVAGDEPADDELDGELVEDLDPAVATGAHGELVSTVAHCAPAGAEAREAGLPTHGFFVSAAARGDSVDFTAEDASLSADLSTLAGAEEFCSLVDDLVAVADEDDVASEGVIATNEPVEETEEPDEGTDESDEGTDESDDSEGDEAIDEDEGDEPADQDDEEAGDSARAAERSRGASDASRGRG